MGNFILPDWAAPLPEPPPPDPAMLREQRIVDDTHAESVLNDFIAAKQDALFHAPDAFYRSQGEDAIHAAPVATQNLEQLRSDLLDGLGNDYQRKRLGEALDAQMQLARGQMARHVAEQSLARPRRTASRSSPRKPRIITTILTCWMASARPRPTQRGPAPASATHRSIPRSRMPPRRQRAAAC